MDVTVLLGISLTLLLAWINGANNAGNVIGAAVGAKSISAKKALQLAFIFEIIGATVLGHYVSTTIMRGIIDPGQLGEDVLTTGVVVVAFSATIWMFIATYLRVPLSVTQAVVGGIVGFGLATLGVSGVAWSVLALIVFSWPVTLILAVVLSILLYRLYTRVLLHAGNIRTLLLVFTTLLHVCVSTTLLVAANSIFSGTLLLPISLLVPIPISALYMSLLEKRLRGDYYEVRYTISRHLLLVSASLAAFSHGAHDVGASAGLLQVLVDRLTTSSSVEDSVSRVVLLVSGFTIALGMLNWGYRVLGTLAEKITPLTPESGFTAQLSAAFTTLLVTRLGLPSSTTLAITGAIIGVGLARSREYVNIKTVTKVFATWTMSFPATLLISLATSTLILR